MMVAWAGSLTEECSQTCPSKWTPAGILASKAPNFVPSKATRICLIQSHGTAAAGKNGAKPAKEGGRAKKSEAFTGALITKKPLRNSGFCRSKATQHVSNSLSLSFQGTFPDKPDPSTTPIHPSPASL